MTTADGVDFVRTPDACFENLPDWSYEAQYVEIDGLRQAYVDVGSGESGETILLLHGQPSWSYLYRDMIPVLADAGHRVIAMDHLGMGRSDKPTDPDYYTYLGHTSRLEAFIQELELEQGNLNIFVQDWGSLVGLYVIGTNPDWFDRVVVGNGFLPEYEEGVVPFEMPDNPRVTRRAFHNNLVNTPEQQEPLYDEDGNRVEGRDFDRDVVFGIWIDYARNDERFMPSLILESETYFPLIDEEEAAYDAPFPSREYMGGVRAFPGLTSQLPGVTQVAWGGLETYENPLLTIWGNNDAGNLGLPETQQQLLDRIPGTEGWDHVRLDEASHFLQDDLGEEIAQRVNTFIASASVAVTAEPTDNALLQYHEGYWVTEVEVEGVPFPVTLINDIHVDVETGDVTVYGQAQVLGRIIAPAQAGPGEMVEHFSGNMLGMHPNGVYLNGSGEELTEADGTGSWWIKHPILQEGGYNNWVLLTSDYSFGGQNIEGTLLEDGVTMTMRSFFEDEITGFPVDNDAIADEFYGNTRTLNFEGDAITHEVGRYEPANIDPDAGPIDYTSTLKSTGIFECVVEPSLLDDLARECPTREN
ncbi:MAG: haloalkane dehalogenase [Chloroflexota bacterium]